MANIEITPINISGVKIPINLLDNLLGQKVDYSNLVYPMDLATNPQYCHAIQFSIHDYTYDIADALFNRVSGLIDAAGNKTNEALNNFTNHKLDDASLKSLYESLSSSIKSTYSEVKFKELYENNSAEFKSAFTNTINANLTNPYQKLQNLARSAPGELEQFVTKIGEILPNGTDDFKLKPKRESLAHISLYMPDTLVTNFNSSYDPVSLTKTFQLAGYGANAIADATKNKSATESTLSNLLSDDYRRGIVGGLAGQVNPDLGGLLGQALKRVPNPQVQMVYRGINLREFTFDFTFTPASAKEAEEVDQIIKTFTYYSLPDITAGAGGQFFIPPQIFKIKFAFLGDNGIAGQISDVFRNSLTNFMGNQFTKVVTGSNPTDDIATAKTAKIFQINDCVLKDVQINYAPNGWASYNDGFPIQTTISLTFSEIDLVNKKTMELEGFAPRNASNYRTEQSIESAVSNIDKQIENYKSVKTYPNPSGIPGTL